MCDYPYVYFYNADSSLLNLHQYRIDSSKFSVGNKYDTCPNFIRAVIKVQQEKEDILTLDEAESIVKWKIIIHEPDAFDVGPQTSGLSDFDRLNLERQQNKKIKSTIKYC